MLFSLYKKLAIESSVLGLYNILLKTIFKTIELIVETNRIFEATLYHLKQI